MQGYTYILLAIAGVLASCGTSKKAVQNNGEESYEYRISQIHMEPVNSAYDNLISDYLEALRDPNEVAAENFAKDTLAYMSKSECMGKCPVYTITILNNGKVKYEGIENVNMVGIYESELEGDMKGNLTNLLSKVPFLELPKTFPRNVTINGKSQVKKMVLSNTEFKFNYTINYGEPQEITDIEVYLDQLIQDLSWVQI